VSIWASIGTAIWNQLQPWLDAKWQEVKPKIFDMIREQFDEWMPKVMKAALVGAVKGGGEVVVDGTDRVTNIIPGQMDDDIIDPLVKQGMDFLNSILGQHR
jgi:hypothetical protein